MKFFKKTMLAIVAMGALAACSDSQNGGNEIPGWLMLQEQKFMWV